MQKIILKRDLNEKQCCFVSEEDGNYITDRSKEPLIEERLAYGSYEADIYTGRTFLGQGRNIALWGPCHLEQTNDMNLRVEI